MALHFIKVIYQPLYTVVNTDTRARLFLQQPFQTRFSPVSYTHLDVYKRQISVRYIFEFVTTDKLRIYHIILFIK